MACDVEEYVDNVAGSSSFGECKQCPLNSATPEPLSPSTQLSIDNCVCGMGFTERGDFDLTNSSHTATGADHKCEQCTTGKYKNLVGDGPCEACPDVAMTSVAPFVSPTDDCLCIAGYYRDGDVCELCAAGTYRGTMSNEPCIACPPNHYCPTGSTEPTDCPVPSTSSEGSGASTECACDAGFFNNDDSSTRVCSGCVRGKYQPIPDKTACIDCAIGKFSTEIEQTAESTCVECAAGKYRNQDAVDELDYLCTDCPTESYNEATGSTSESACSPCTKVNGFMRKTGPGGGFTEAQACKCPAGQYDTGDGTHLSTSERPCAACPAGQYSTQIDTKTCSLCVAGKKGVTPQQTSEENACSDCVAGKFNTEDGETVCEFCASDADGQAQYQHQSGQTDCTACTANSGHTLDGTGALAYEAASCECNAGYTGGGDTSCVACAPGTYRLGRASGEPCDGCGTNADSPAASAERSACTCTAGFLSAPASADGACQIPGDTDCSHLSDHATLGLANERVCKPCPADQYCSPTLTAEAGISPLGARACRAHSSSPAGSDDVRDCLCDGGYYYLQADDTREVMPPHACSVCPAPSGDPKRGFYCPPDNDDAQPCGDHTATGPSEPGSGSNSHSTPEACKCLSGFWRNCVPNADGPGYIQHNSDGSTSACDRYDGNGDPLEAYWTTACVQCLADDVCEYGESMQHCPDNSAAGAGTSDFLDCLCGAGFERVFSSVP